jgi:D-serine deaminase-like pyridoxal phosphate-dependent protein
MSSPQGQPPEALDSPQLLIDLDAVDANLLRMQRACQARGVDLRVHFKSLKFPTVKAPAPAPAAR